MAVAVKAFSKSEHVRLGGGPLPNKVTLALSEIERMIGLSVAVYRPDATIALIDAREGAVDRVVPQDEYDWATGVIDGVLVEVARALADEWKRQHRREWYHYYLTTDAWDRRRKAVLRRARNACEGCGRNNRPLQVHHMTYENVGDEFLWELRAVCDECHERCHAHDH